MNQQKIYALAMGLAMCCGVLFAPAPAGHAASNTKTTTSFSYSTKVVGNTVVITGNSTTSTSVTSKSKSAVSKTPAVIKPPSSSKKSVSTKSSTSQKQTTVKITAKKPATAAPAKKTATAAPAKAKKTVVSYFIPIRQTAAPIIFKLKPKPAPKFTSKVITKTTPKATTPPKKITVKIPAASSSKIKSTAGEASFTPETITASAFPPAVSVSDPVYLNAPATAHYRIGNILGKTAQVRFTPIDSSWSFSDGSQASGLSPTHTFLSPGTFSASVTVRYQVSYRFAGETIWNNDVGHITLTDQVKITVSAKQNSPTYSTESEARPYLVGENCLKNPLAFSC